MKNKKELYESIMKNVAKAVKKQLNEGIYHDPELTELWDNIISHDIATEAELHLVTDINGYTIEALLEVLYARTGYHTWKQYLSEDEDADEETEESEDEDSENNEDENITYNDIINALEILSKEELQDVIDDEGEDAAQDILDDFQYPINGSSCADACVRVAEDLLRGKTVKQLRKEIGDDEI